jgi:hypothetical protein
MKITIETIPHREQRYPTVGDWEIAENGDIAIRVSELGDWRHEAAIALHELVEVLLCRNDGVSGTLVDAFDRAYDGLGEPGDDPKAPYQRQHCFATAVERMLIAALGLAWAEYEEALP